MSLATSKRRQFGRGFRDSGARSGAVSLPQLVDSLERAAIHGRGGGGFPTATKLQAVAAQKRTPVVVVNATEGEPLSGKDRYLLRERTDTVLDGALAAAAALHADEIVIAVDQSSRAEAAAVDTALARRPEFNRRGLQTYAAGVPSGYVSGQETALIAALSGRPAKPTLTPPYPFERGLHGRPTLVSNAETYAHIGCVAAGSYDGTRLISLGGAVAAPGLIEIAQGTTLEAVIDTAGGFLEPVGAVLLGGYGGAWAPLQELLQTPLEEPQLKASGLTLGAGIVFVLGESACPVAEVAHVVRWMNGESAGQCGPCVNGLGAISDALDGLTLRGGHGRSQERILRWAEQVRRRGACAHPDGVARFVTSALEVFAGDFADHAAHGACEACAGARILPTPRHSRARTR